MEFILLVILAINKICSGFDIYINMKDNSYIGDCPRCNIGFEPLVPCGQIDTSFLSDKHKKCTPCKDGFYQSVKDSTYSCIKCIKPSDPQMLTIESCGGKSKGKYECRDGYYENNDGDCNECCPKKGCYSWSNLDRKKKCGKYVKQCPCGLLDYFAGFLEPTSTSSTSFAGFIDEPTSTSSSSVPPNGIKIGVLFIILIAVLGAIFLAVIYRRTRVKDIFPIWCDGNKTIEDDGTALIEIKLVENVTTESRNSTRACDIWADDEGNDSEQVANEILSAYSLSKQPEKFTKPQMEWKRAPSKDHSESANSVKVPILTNEFEQKGTCSSDESVLSFDRIGGFSHGLNSTIQQFRNDTANNGINKNEVG